MKFQINSWACTTFSIGSGLLALPAIAQQYVPEPVVATQFSDDFSGGFGNWTVGTNIIDHTIFGQTPTLTTGASGPYSTYARMKLDTYDPQQFQNGVSFLGTQIQTKQSFNLPKSGGVNTGQGIRYQIAARVESTGSHGPQGNANNTSIPVAKGLNAAAFSYSYSSPSNQNYHDEIDFENLTAQQLPRSVSNPNGATGNSNVYFGTSNGDATLATSYKTDANGGNNNSYYGQYPYVKNDAGITTPSNDIYQWHTYTIDWFPAQIDWYVDGQLIREEAAGTQTTRNPAIYIPNQAMPYYLNFWAPGSEFTDAYDAGLTPTATAANNNEYFYDIAAASVSTIVAAGTPTPEPAGMTLAAMAALSTLRRRRSASVSLKSS